MKFRVPIVLSERREAGEPAPRIEARAAFLPQFRREGSALPRVLERMAEDVRKHLRELARLGDGRALARLAAAPEVTESSLELQIELKSGTLSRRFLFLTYERHGQRLAFTPEHPDIVFQMERGTSLRERAVEVFREFFREAERNERFDLVPGGTPPRRTWLTEIELDLSLRPPKKREPPAGFALFGGPREVSGEAELERTGRCLDRMDPDELHRALCREVEVTELTRLLTAEERRPVLLLGPPQCGKTVLVHEFVSRRAATKRTATRKFGRSAGVWMLTPQRLVSGMSYVGQWQERLLAILGEARRRDHVLYFEDLAGLWLAGKTSHSSISLAHLLKPSIERGEVRLLAEMSAERWRVLRELDRGFADLFHVLPVREPAAPENLRILLGVQRTLEHAHRTSFEIDALPAVLDLQRRHSPELAFPGKAAGFLRTLAAKHARGLVDRRAVLTEFQVRTGLAMPFIETDTPLARAEIVKGLRRSMVGQDEAVAALADALGLARARLNDPRRPLGAFLFLGPTGVGKTQCAKAAAEYLFGDAARLLRFDMNEFISSDAVARLSGTLFEPDGLLTSAVRRQPFCVVLLDEIEKAHPDVFDLLLQVLGEGRLTDALGRTASFANALIILTSNLGVREAGRRLGFRAEGEADESASAHYVRAAEQFFRPEFVNRLDRIVPFARLSRAEVEGIADRVLADVLVREGLQQRRCVLRMDAGTRARIVDLGYHPELGARALKRAVERHLVQPVATQLAALAADQRCIVTLRYRDGAFAVEVAPLTEAPWRGLPPALAKGDEERFADQLEAARERMKTAIDQLAPIGAVSLTELSPSQARYFLLREAMTRIDERWPARGADERAHRVSWNPRSPGWETRGPRWLGRERRVADLRAETAAVQEVDETALERRSVESTLDERWAWLLRELSLVELMLGSPLVDERVLIISAGEATGDKSGPLLTFADFDGYRATNLPPAAAGDGGPPAVSTLLEGPGALALARSESGLMLWAESGGLRSSRAYPLKPNEDPLTALPCILARFADEPAGEIIRVVESGEIVDRRSGHRGVVPVSDEGWRELCLSALPWPAEVGGTLSTFNPSELVV